MTINQRLFFSFFLIFWNIPPFYSLTRSLFALTTFPCMILPWNLGPVLDSKLSTKKHVVKICQTAYFELKRISSIRRFLLEDAPRLFLLPVSSQGLITAIVSLWVHPVLSSNLSRKFKTLLQYSDSDSLFTKFYNKESVSKAVIIQT